MGETCVKGMLSLTSSRFRLLFTCGGMPASPESLLPSGINCCSVCLYSS